MNLAVSRSPGVGGPDGAGGIDGEQKDGTESPEEVELGGEQQAKDAGKWRLEGKEYVVADGDVVHFRFNV